MTRLAQNRDTHLTTGEIAAVALRCFDEGSSPPSIRQIAAILGTSPSAIYHHVGSQAEIIQAVVDLVWAEAATEFLSLLTERPSIDPADTMVKAGLATRRTFSRHYRVAPFIATTPDMTSFSSDAVNLMGDLLESMSLSPEQGAAAFHSYASFTIGSVLFSAMRRITTEDFGAVDAEEGAEPDPTDRPSAMRRELIDVVSVAGTDPDRDEALFVDGLRRLVATFAWPPEALPAVGR
jgi:AcrR family transcriptional regulator